MYRIYRSAGGASWMLGLEVGPAQEPVLAPVPPPRPEEAAEMIERVKAEVLDAVSVFNEVHGTHISLARIEWMDSAHHVPGIYRALACELLARIAEGRSETSR